ncbi:MAG: hypothetical protein C5B60_05540 [Chloroflexi bacterium]|nr:MAG: hypothetical protein C5B60_05540 [Chloroflexota bacterium]
MRVTKPIPPGYLTLAQAAELLGVRRQSIEWLLKTGRLRAVPFGGRPDRPAMWLLPREAVASYARRRERRALARLEAMTAARAALEAR